MPKARPTAASSVAGSSLAVDATGPDDAWLIANQFSGYIGPLQATTAHWDGTAWREVPIPNPVNTNLYAVGTITTNGRQDILVLRWDGVRWSRVLAASGRPDPELNAATAIGPGTVWAVGRHYQGTPQTGASRTLTVRGVPLK